MPYCLDFNQKHILFEPIEQTQSRARQMTVASWKNPRVLICLPEKRAL